MSVQLRIDASRCQGHGRCYDLAPEFFDADDEGYAQLVGDGRVPDGAEDKALVAVGNCPEDAITAEA